MAKLINSYPFWIRLWHSVNGILCLILVITGLMMQYSSPVKLEISLPTAIFIHNNSGILLIISWIFFVIANGLSKNGSYYWLNLKLFKESIIQFRYYSYGIFKHEPSPFKEDPNRKFNPLQQLAYFSTMYIFLPLMVITGFIMVNVERLLIDEKSIFVYQACDFIHISSAFMISVFLVIHLYLVYIEGLENLKKIIFKKKHYTISGK
jgi:thiosulfate reductase cytochrome b subunit